MVPETSITFVSQASITSGVVKTYGLRKRVEAVKGCRKLTKKDMKYNDTMPKMKVDPERYVSFCSLLACFETWPYDEHG
jgi:urease